MTYLKQFCLATTGLLDYNDSNLMKRCDTGLYNDFQNEKLSALGFGAMRLPLLDNGSIDQAELDRMVDAAIAAGVNYFDTAHPYHGGKSEGALCKSLRQMSRLDKLMSSHKSWEEICRERAKAAEKK